MVKFENKLCHTGLSRLDKPRAWLGFTVFILDKRKEERSIYKHYVLAMTDMGFHLDFMFVNGRN